MKDDMDRKDDMDTDEIARRLRSAFEREYQQPSPGLDSRMQDTIKQSAWEAGRGRHGLEAVALLISLVTVLVLMIPHVLNGARQTTATTPQPTPTMVPEQQPFPVLTPATLQNTKGATWLFSGDRVYRSTDGRSNWSDVSPTLSSSGPYVAYALDSQHAWTAQSSTVQGLNSIVSVVFYRTSNGGANWERVGNAPIVGSWLHEITFVDTLHGWLLVSLALTSVSPSPGTPSPEPATSSEWVSIWGTSDGGRSWVQLSSSSSSLDQQSGGRGQLSSNCYKTAITFRDDTTGWVTAACPYGRPFLYLTSDGGRTWQLQALPPAQAQTNESPTTSPIVMPPVFFGNTFGLLPVDLELATPGAPSRVLVIYLTRDGGLTWTPTVPVRGGRVFAVVKPDYWIVIAPPRQVVHTNDGRRYAQNVSDTDLGNIVQVAFADPQHALALVAQANGGYRLLQTADGGSHWSVVMVRPPFASPSSTPNASATPSD